LTNFSRTNTLPTVADCRQMWQNFINMRSDFVVDNATVEKLKVFYAEQDRWMRSMIRNHSKGGRLLAPCGIHLGTIWWLVCWLQSSCFARMGKMVLLLWTSVTVDNSSKKNLIWKGVQ